MVSKKKTFVTQMKETYHCLTRRLILPTRRRTSLLTEKSGKTRSYAVEKIVFSAGDFFALAVGTAALAAHHTERERSW
jgi:hypothetical protein